MSKPFDYSKWDNIELSDDEEDVHPNIDRESWFRMKHQSRVEREEREETDKKKMNSEIETTKLRMEEITRTLKSIENEDDSDDELEDVDGLKAELETLQIETQVRVDRLDELEKNKKWNVDNMCRVVEERTIVNPKAGENKFSNSGYALPDDEPEKAAPTPVEGKKKENAVISNDKQSAAAPTKTPTASSTTADTTKPSTLPKPIAAPVSNKNKAGPTPESIAMLSYHDFTEKYADVVEEFMTKQSLTSSRDFLIQKGNILLQENAANYLLLASLEDEMNGFRDKMRLTARQSQLISNITELAKSLKSHPGNVILPFFKRLEEKQHFEGFNQGYETFVQNLIKRAVVKRKEMDEQRLKEMEEMEENGEGETVDLNDIPKEERLGPGGLDPVEVFDSLPESMQEAFESRDTDALKSALMAMPAAEAEEHMKRCVDSGLWNEG